MKFRQKFRQDMKFRRNVILTFIALALVIGNYQGEIKKEATSQELCNLANTVSGDNLGCVGIQTNACMPLNLAGNVDASALTLCDGYKCGVGRRVQNGLDAYGCFLCVPVGLRVRTASECCSGVAKPSEYDDFNFICESSGQTDPNKPDPKSLCSNTVQKSIANMVGRFEFFARNGCKTNYHFVVFGGGFLALEIMLAAV